MSAALSQAIALAADMRADVERNEARIQALRERVQLPCGAWSSHTWSGRPVCSECGAVYFGSCGKATHPEDWPEFPEIEPVTTPVARLTAEDWIL